MTKYKYTRKYWWEKLIDSAYYGYNSAEIKDEDYEKLKKMLFATTTKSSKEKEFIPQNGEEFWFKKKSPTPSTNIKEIEKIKHTEFTTTKIDECIDNLSVLVCNLGDKVNEIIDVINSLNTIIKK